MTDSPRLLHLRACPASRTGPLDDPLAPGRLHEVIALDEGDGPSAAGFVAALARRLGAVGPAGPVGALGVVWLRVGEGLHPWGLRDLGLDPACVVAVAAPDVRALLRAGVEAARCAGVGVAVIEVWREGRLLDLAASRRLALAVAASGATALLLRVGPDPGPSAAHTRWGVRAAPSRSPGVGAPGPPTFDVELLRRRDGPPGGPWRVEWDRDASAFRPAPLPGAVVPVPRHRQARGDGRGACAG